MNPFIGLLFLAGIIYGIFVNPTFWMIYGVVVLIYTIFVVAQKDPRENTKRKTMLIATWGCK